MRQYLVWLSLCLCVTGVEVQADQDRKHLGVTRADMVELFESQPLGFVMEEETSMSNGEPTIKGLSNDCPERYLTVEFTGSRTGNVRIATVRYVRQPDAIKKCSIKAELAMKALLHKVFPDWHKETYPHGEWLDDGIREGRSRLAYRKDAEVELFIIKDGQGGTFYELNAMGK